MLTINLIRENKDLVVERLKIKNFDASNLINKIIDLDNSRKDYILKAEEKKAELNKLSEQIGILFKSGKQQEANEIKESTIKIKETAKHLDDLLSSVEEEIQSILVQIPNIPHISVPKGKVAEDNIIEFMSEKQLKADTTKLPHWELASKYNIIDFELGVKIAGAGFPVYKGKGAKLQRALINFFLDEAEKAGFNEVNPPIVVNEASGFGTGQLPDKEGQMYFVGEDKLYLIPTAEVPVTNIFRDVILNAEDFPVKTTAYTPCFRREAGSYGKDVRGLNRLHQFDKVEIVTIEHPDKSYQTLETMVAHVEGLLNKLELPYRKLRLCGGDMSFTSALTYDLEVFSMAQDKWLEVSSISNFESYQANRLKLRFKEKGEKKTKLAHTLNGSALALPRIMAALLENNQTNDGIILPKAIAKYCSFDKID
jgi:seryl-tRNA synthetase